MSGAHFDLSDYPFANFDDLEKSTSEQMKNYTSNRPLSTTASISETARNMTLVTQAEILQGVGFFEPEEYITQILADELSNAQESLLTEGSPFLDNTLTRPGPMSSRKLNNLSTRRAITMAFSSIHPSDLDDYERIQPPGMEYYSNGELPPEALVTIEGHPGLKLWHEAAAAWKAMRAALLNDGFVNDENNKMINSAYRSYEAQYLIKHDRNKDGIVRHRDDKGYSNPDAATPGASKHGWGIAVDFDPDFYQDQKSTQGMTGFEWLNTYAHLYGFVWPDWAQKAGDNYRGYYEPWHWEYRGHVYIERVGDKDIISANYGLY